MNHQPTLSRGDGAKIFLNLRSLRHQSPPPFIQIIKEMKGMEWAVISIEKRIKVTPIKIILSVFTFFFASGAAAVPFGEYPSLARMQQMKRKSCTSTDNMFILDQSDTPTGDI